VSVMPWLISIFLVTGFRTATAASSIENAQKTYSTRRDNVDISNKYQPARYPDDKAGAFFSGVFSDNVVLQRKPARPVVYGVVIGASLSTSVTVTVFDRSSRKKIMTSYSRVASVVKVDEERSTAAGGLYATWKVFLAPTSPGGNYTISVSCQECVNATMKSTLQNVVFGDVWFCAGQSNMRLPMHFDTSRNVTYNRILNEGKYGNIRMYSVAQNNQPDGGYDGTDLDIIPPPPERQPWGDFAGGGWLLPSVGTYGNASCRMGLGDSGCTNTSHCCTRFSQPNDDWIYNSVDQFSAACWHFAEHLTDKMEANDESIMPIGLISSSWGGTMVEHWQPNATLNSGVCKNSSGYDYSPWQNKRWDIDSGALWNGMILPFVNMSIKGALWYQGENNVFQCHDAGDTDQSKGGRKPSGGPFACGNVGDSTGYACMMRNLVLTWRKAWSAELNTTPEDFPFGIVTLAGGTSEGHDNNMAAFRFAQTGNRGFLPSQDMPNTFSAQAFDAGDPCIHFGQCCANGVDGQGGWPCVAGEGPYTQQFMGGIHPRVKKIVGVRLAKAARALVYGDSKEVWTGPVLVACSVSAREGIVLKFDRSLLKDDTIMVLDHTTTAIPFTDDLGVPFNPAILSLLQQLGPESPMEVQINGSSGNFTDGVWLPVKIEPKCAPTGEDHPEPGTTGCNWNYTTSTRTPGWDEVVIRLGGIASQLMANITGIRYAWNDNPCCPSMNRLVVPCPPNSCPIQTHNSTMPAVPFWATINNNGLCDWISTQNGIRVQEERSRKRINEPIAVLQS